MRLKHSLGYEFSDTGVPTDKPAIVLLHGLLGDPEGWSDIVTALTPHYRVLVPRLPIDRIPMRDANVHGLVDFVQRFVTDLELGKVILVGNSLGGQIALLYTLSNADSVVGLTLLGSSGIDELELGTTTFKRRDRAFIRKHAAKTFYDPIHVTDALVERIYQLTTNRSCAVRLIRMARSSRNINLSDDLEHINVPTALIWGTADQITPREVAYTFSTCLPMCELHFIDECGHAPMMEAPDVVNRLLLNFLQRVVHEPSPSIVTA